MPAVAAAAAGESGRCCCGRFPWGAKLAAAGATDTGPAAAAVVLGTLLAGTQPKLLPACQSTVTDANLAMQLASRPARNRAHHVSFGPLIQRKIDANQNTAGMLMWHLECKPDLPASLPLGTMSKRHATNS